MRSSYRESLMVNAARPQASPIGSIGQALSLVAFLLIRIDASIPAMRPSRILSDGRRRGGSK